MHVLDMLPTFHMKPSTIILCGNDDISLLCFVLRLTSLTFSEHESFYTIEVVAFQKNSKVLWWRRVFSIDPCHYFCVTGFDSRPCFKVDPFNTRNYRRFNEHALYPTEASIFKYFQKYNDKELTINLRFLCLLIW